MPFIAIIIKVASLFNLNYFYDAISRIRRKAI